MFEADQHTERTVVYMKNRVIKIFKWAGISILLISTVLPDLSLYGENIVLKVFGSIISTHFLVFQLSNRMIAHFP